MNIIFYETRDHDLNHNDHIVWKNRNLWIEQNREESWKARKEAVQKNCHACFVEQNNIRKSFHIK